MATETQQKKPIAYFSFDIEADGPAPGRHCMLQLGIWIFNEKGEELKSFCVNIKEHDESSVPDESTMKFWEQHKTQWESMMKSRKSPERAMRMLSELLKEFTKDYEVAWIAKPKSFDWTFLKFYYHNMWEPPKNSPELGFKCICLSESLRTTARILGTTKDKLEQAITAKNKIPEGTKHNALDDAKKQGLIYFHLLELQNTTRDIMKTMEEQLFAWKLAGASGQVIDNISWSEWKSHR